MVFYSCWNPPFCAWLPPSEFRSIIRGIYLEPHAVDRFLVESTSSPALFPLLAFHLFRSSRPLPFHLFRSSRPHTLRVASRTVLSWEIRAFLSSFSCLLRSHQHPGERKSKSLSSRSWATRISEEPSKKRGNEEERSGSGETLATMLVDSFRVESPNVKYTEETIESKYEYTTTDMVHEVMKNGKYEWVARPKSVTYQFVTKRKLPKLG